MTNADGLPNYAELRERTDAPPGSTWGLLGEVGTIAHLTPDRVRESSGSIRTGRVFNLDYPINAFEPYPSGTRYPANQTVFFHNPNHRDDYLDTFYLQSTTQLDGLRHIRHPTYGFYGDTADDAIVAQTPALGIQHWAQHGIAGRGVLVDIKRHLEDEGRPLDPRSGQSFSVEDLDRALAGQGAELRAGDLLLIHTGWARWLLTEATAEEHAALPGNLRCPGLLQSEDAVAWIWNHRLSVVAGDNFALECFPPDPASPFHAEVEPTITGGQRHGGIMHRALIALLGLAIGELWKLDELAADCAARGRYDFFVTASPLNLIGGVGSPANATAIT